VIVDPDEVRQFANSLKRAAEAIKGRKTDTNSSYKHLTQVWKDEKYRQFDRVFLDTMTQLDQFLRLAEDYAGYLRKKAAKAKAYLDSGGYH
jgi:uncharacterized protein YukE